MSTKFDESMDPNGVPQLLPTQVHSHADQLVLIDVRRPEEFNNELGHAPGAKLITLGHDIDAFLASADKSQAIAFLCRSGARSAHVTQVSRQLGFTKTFNMAGVMLAWNQAGLPVERD